MKFSHLILITVTLLASLNSCNKSIESESFNPSSINSIAISQVLKANNSELQKNLYRLLTPSEKSVLWNSKYSKMLTDDILNFEQRNFIIRLKELATPQYFIKNTNHKSELKFNKDELKVDAISLFGISGAYYLLASIVDEKQANLNFMSNNISSESISAPPNNCSCSKTDDWCSYPTTCIGNNCASTYQGCGWWLEENCNGTCVDRTWY